MELKRNQYIKYFPLTKKTNYFIRTTEGSWTGCFIDLQGQFIQLDCAALIEDYGELSKAVSKGKSELKGVEPIGTAYINVEYIVEAFPWTHDLPTEQKKSAGGGGTGGGGNEK